MKQFLFSAMTVVYLTTTLSSCKKSNDEAIPVQTIQVSISADQTYQYDLGNFGDEEGAAINRQASNYEVSKTTREINTGKVTYQYKPAPGFTGMDEVELKSSRGSDGASPNTAIKITVIKLTVTK